MQRVALALSRALVRRRSWRQGLPRYLAALPGLIACGGLFGSLAAGLVGASGARAAAAFQTVGPPAANGSATPTPPAGVAGAATPPGGAPEPTPIALEDGPHLFIDDYLIETTRNVARTVNQPRRFLPAAMVTGGIGGSYQFEVAVLRKADTGMFRLWYERQNPDPPNVLLRGCLGYLESQDGIHLIQPSRCVNAPTFLSAKVIDGGPRNANPAERFKTTYVLVPTDIGGMRVAFSPDGLNWTPYNDGNPVLDAPIEDDIWSPYFDPIRNRYGVLMKLQQQHTWTNAEGVTQTQNLRLVGQSTSIDFKHWTTPQVMFVPDSGDQGITQWYSCGGFMRRGDLIICMLRVLRDDVVVSGAPTGAYGYGYTVLAWTRDGQNWERDRHTDMFFAPDPRVGAWDHAHAWIASAVEVGDEVYLYYGGYRWGHKYNALQDRQIGLVRMQRDRYVARQAGSLPGILRTHLVAFDAGAITLNADAKGGVIRVQILDANGNPIPGFTYADCQPIVTDSLDARVQCSRSLGELRNMSVQLEFSLKNARVFAFTLN